MVVRGGEAVLALGLVIGVATGCGLSGRRLGPTLEAPSGDQWRALETVSASGVGESLTLRFAWPDGLEGRCRSMQRTVDGGRTTGTGDTTYRIRAEYTASAVRILTDEESIETPAAARRVVEIVETDGRYRRAEGVEEALASMPRGLGPGEAARAAALVRRRLARTWKLRVGAWAGRELPLGAMYSATAPEQVFGDPVRMRIAIQADGRVPCRTGDVERACVRLRFRSQPEDPAPTALVQPLLTALFPGEGIDADTVVANTASVITSAVIVTEPDTLVPHYFVFRRRLVLAGNSPARPMLSGDRHEELTQSCAWR